MLYYFIKNFHAYFVFHSLANRYLLIIVIIMISELLFAINNMRFVYITLKILSNKN